MNLSNIAFKFNNMLSMFGNKVCQSSLLATESEVIQTVDINGMGGKVWSWVLEVILEFILKIVYLISTFVMSFIEFIQYVVSIMLGITTDISEFVVLDSRNPLVKMLTNETVLKVFKYMIGVSIVLVIIFTIYAIIKSEYSYAAGDKDGDTVNIGRILKRSLKSLFTMGIFPLVMILGVVLVNAILAGFNDVLKGGENTTLAGQVFMSGAYTANNYRNFANEDERIPIVVNFDDPYISGQHIGYSTEDLVNIYKPFQPRAEELYDKMLEKSFGSFNETIVYRNNKLYNKENFNSYEQFVCTREQYYVMADFIDYAIKNNVTFYIKNMTDSDITWKYVEQSIYDTETQTLRITYKDASNLNNGKSYTVEYCPSDAGIVSPIADAIETLSAILAIGEYAENTFNVLSRVEEAINIVEWNTDKVLLKLSPNYNTENRTSADETILYEWSRLKYNNDLDCSLEDLIKGYELPLKKVTKQFYQVSSSSYVTTDEIYVVEINGTHYAVEENPDLKDDEGNFIYDQEKDNYYTLIESDFGLESVGLRDANGYYVYETNKTYVSEEEKAVLEAAGYTVLEDLNGFYYFKKHYLEEDNIVTFKEVGGKYYKLSTSFRDTIVEILSGTYEEELADGTIAYSTYNDKVSEVIKQVSWPKKLINDIQTIYKDININQMISTGKWLEQLGEYYDGATINSGEYGSNISTGLIHPLGLIMSEMFLGEINDSDYTNIYGSLVFSSKFDDETVRALMASLVGEENYHQLNYQLKYFNEIYNVFMGPVLDQIAYYEDFDLMSGNEASVQLYTYKAYLASILISESAGQWFYNTAVNMFNANASVDLWNDSGSGYKLYSSLTYDERSRIKSVLKAANKRLEEQYIEPGDAAYPEYLDALKDYIDGYDLIDEDAFHGRLEIVLQSTKSDEYKLNVVKNRYNIVETYYQTLINYINGQEGRYASIVKYIPTLEDVTYEDGNTNVANVLAIDSMREMVDKLVEVVEEFTTNNSYSTNENLIIYVSSYVASLDQYFDKLVDYVTPDKSYTYNGQRKELEKQMESYILQAQNIINNLLVEDKDTENQVKALLNGLEFTFKGSSAQTKPFYAPLKWGTYSWKLEDIENVKRAEKIDTWNKMVANSDAFIKVMQEKSDPRYNKIWENETIYSQLMQYFNSIDKAIETQEIIDRLNKYYISYAITSSGYDNQEISLDIVVNSKHYEVGQNFTVTKFIEYALGSDYLQDKGYSTMFVDDDYTGFITTDASGNYVSSFDELRQFLVEIGDMTASLYQMTNFGNLSASTKDELVIGSEIDEEQDLSKYILYMLIDNDYLPSDILSAFFNIDIAGGVPEGFKVSVKNKIDAADNITAQKYLNTVLSYILQTEPDSEKKDFVDYSKMTLKELRQKCMKFLINFEDQYGESVEQNQKRYLAGLALACSDWSVSVGVGANTYQTGAIDQSWSKDRRNSINLLRVDGQSQAVILKLCGLENRPYEELIDAEYSIDFDVKTIDEANGNYFVVCTYDEKLKSYVPFLMSNTRNANSELMRMDEDGKNWMQKYGYRGPYTSYYVSGDDNNKVVFYPIVAKGVIVDNLPTAIREVDGRIEFYRDDVIIRNPSSVGLTQYFVSPSQINVNYTGVSLISNTFSILFTGKTIVENLCETIPRFATHADYNLLFGKTTKTTASLQDGYWGISYNFDESVCPPMEQIYTLKNFNMIAFLIALFCITGALWKALWGLTRRMFEVTIYFLLGPVAISTMAYKTDSKEEKDGKSSILESDSAFEPWKDKIIERLLAVFAYAIGFNIFFISVPVITNMTLFENVESFRNIPIFANPDIDFLNEIARIIFICCSAFLSTRAPALFAKISQTADGFVEGRDLYNKTKSVIKDTIWEVGDVVSGQLLVDTYENLKDTVVDYLPGVRITQQWIEKNQEKIDAYQKAFEKVAAKVIAKVAKYIAKVYTAGAVPDCVLEAAADQLEKELVAGGEYSRKKKKAAKERQKKRKKERQERNKQRKAIRARGDEEKK